MREEDAVTAPLRLGIAHHLGWAVAVTATPDGDVVDRRRIALTAPGAPPAPVEHGIAGLDDQAASALLATTRTTVARVTAASLAELVSALPDRIGSMSLRHWPPDVPTDVATLRRAPWNAVADSVMYRQVLAEAADDLGWQVHLYEAAAVERGAARVLGDRAHEVLHGPRRRLGPPWTKDHRVALAAALLAAGR